MYPQSLFRFRQDLRVYDNIWLYQAFKSSKQVIPIFIFDENLIPTFGWIQDPRFAFLKDALLNLDKQLQKIWSQLTILKWKPEKILPIIIKEADIQSIYCNMAYDTYGIQRDSKIKDFCNQNNIWYHISIDNLLQNPQNIKAYKVFSPYFKTWISRLPQIFDLIEIQKIHSTNQNFLQKIKHKIQIINTDILDKFIPMTNKYRPIDWRKNTLKNFDFANYENTKNFPAIPWTSKLSPYIRFGLVSIRQLFNIAKKQKADNYLFELWRREFWHQIAMYFPLSRIQAFQEHRQNIPRQNNKKLFELFCNAQTWYPIIDAAIIQLKTENRMHNRLRMVVASFLTKDLLIDWKRWEEFFKKYLLDYEEVVNIWNRQRSASVWADPKPMRIFSPIRQSQRFDTDAVFIKKHIPQLKNINPEHIHDPLTYPLDYHKPIVDHKQQTILAKQMYFGNN